MLSATSQQQWLQHVVLSVPSPDPSPRNVTPKLRRHAFCLTYHAPPPGSSTSFPCRCSSASSCTCSRICPPPTRAWSSKLMSASPGVYAASDSVCAYLPQFSQNYCCLVTWRLEATPCHAPWLALTCVTQTMRLEGVDHSCSHNRHPLSADCREHHISQLSCETSLSCAVCRCCGRNAAPEPIALDTSSLHQRFHACRFAALSTLILVPTDVATALEEQQTSWLSLWWRIAYWCAPALLRGSGVEAQTRKLMQQRWKQDLPQPKRLAA